jgi:hypothetical protein
MKGKFHTAIDLLSPSLSQHTTPKISYKAIAKSYSHNAKMFTSPNASMALALGSRTTCSEFIAKFVADHPDAAIEHLDACNSFFSTLIAFGALKKVEHGVYESVPLETSDKIFELFMAHKQSSGDFL